MEIKKLKESCQDLIDNADDWIIEKDWSYLETLLRDIQQEVISSLFRLAEERRENSRH